MPFSPTPAILRGLQDRRWPIVILMLFGITERVGWNLVRSVSGETGEAHNIAVALANGAGFADAYRIGQGPTAHMLPVSPLIAGSAYRLLGVNSEAAEIFLACWAIALAIGTYLLLYRAFTRLDVSKYARLGALAVGCVAPVYIGQEAVDFRSWEGGLAVLLSALILDRLLTLDRNSPPNMHTIVLMALLNALLFFVNPALGLGAYACSAIFCLRVLPPRRLATAVVTATAALALFLGPWVVRNAASVGAPILLRSNAGLELALAIHPHALDAGDRRGIFLARLRAIHPAQSDTAYRSMLATGGEVAYSRMLGEQTKRWIEKHPTDTVLLASLHLRQTFAPERWQFGIFGSSLLIGLRAEIASIVGLLGLTGIGLGLYRHRPAWAYPAMLVLAPALLVSLFQPVPRYTYLFYPLLLFCGAYFCQEVARAIGRFDAHPRSKIAAIYPSHMGKHSWRHPVS